ncbi:MAG: phosphotransferase [Nitrospinota bacterium]|nr:phosphotransferase [Nitrospinota bacterium]
MASKPISLVKTFIKNNFPEDINNISHIRGDASDRKYFRVQHEKQAIKSSIIMVNDGPFDDEELPFLKIAKYFKKLNLPVPEIYKYDSLNGIISLEDCGDNLLETFVLEKNINIEDYYSQSVGLISKLQSSYETHSKNSICLESFSDEFFFRELKHTQKFAFEMMLEIPATKVELNGFFSCLCSSICKIPFSLSHRDYHSRNLIFKQNSEIIMLDFQDARKGPITYDLASLIYDSYVSIADTLKKKLIHEFWVKRGKNFFQTKDEFLNSLYETALQRNIKAIGTFAFQIIEKENSRYLSYIPNTVKSVRSHFYHLNAYKRFYDVIAPLLDKLEDLTRRIVS